MQPDRFPQTSLHTIAHDRAAQHLAHREPTRSPLVPSRPPQDKTRSCGWRNAGAPVCTRARNPHAGADARCAGTCCRRDADTVAAAIRPRVAFTARLKPDCESSANSGKGEALLTEAGLHRHPLATLGAPARNHRAAGLGLHPRKKSVRLRAVTTVGLECALGHEKSLLLIRSLGLF